MTIETTIRRTVKAGDIPASWQIDLTEDPDSLVEVVLTLVPSPRHESPKRFVGAGKGLFSNAAEIDAHVSVERDAWGR